MTSSRLDRLFVLLETGSSSITRSAAAKQLGEVQKLHPHELNTLLTRTAIYLKSTNWETRIAAAEAVRAIVSNVPQWNPKGVEVKNEDEQLPPISSIGRLRFDQFDISKVLANSTHLMASEGTEFDTDDDLNQSTTTTTPLDLKEKMAKQRQILNARLGLDVAVKFGIDTTNLFSNDDLIICSSSNNDDDDDDNNKQLTNCDNKNDIIRKPIIDLITNATEGLSSREMNRAKRKARQAINKQRSRDPEDNSTNNNSNDETDKKRLKCEIKDEIINNEINELEIGDASDWPLEWFCDQLSQDLFSSSWEIRHGAATALREILTVHGNGAGKSTYLSASQMEEYHQIWLEDMAIRLLCVLALDRFGDFVSDSVVAPVRETCAQSLCAILKLMNHLNCKNTLKRLLELLNYNEWEARHGGLLGLKYLLAIRDDMINILLPESLPFILNGLSDNVDDVGAVAASSLIPIASKLVELVPNSITIIITKLWDLLAEQDELASACNSFMGLLAAILNLPQAQHLLPEQPLNNVVPRLWPFLSHSTSSVRKATLQTLKTLTERPLDGTNIKWEAQLLQDAMRHVYQRVLVESQYDVRQVAENVWSQLIKNSGLVELLHAACPFITIWLFLSMQPTKQPFDQNYLIQYGKNQRKTKSIIDSFDNTVIAPKLYIGGSETTPLNLRERNAIEVRCMTARMLGLLSCYIIKPAPGIIYTDDIERPIDCYEKVLLVHLNSKSALQRMMIGLIISEWAKFEMEQFKCPELIKERLNLCLNEYIYYDEIATSFTRLTQETRDFIATLKHYKFPLINNTNNNVFTLDYIKELTNLKTKDLLYKLKLKNKLLDNLNERRKTINDNVIQTSNEQLILNISTLAAISGAIVMFRALPNKLTPVVKPLMESIKCESDEILQKITAKHLAVLLEQCCERTPCPNDKIIINLCIYLHCDTEFTPQIYKQEQIDGASTSTSSSSNNETNFWTRIDNYNGIITLNNQQKNAERAILFRRTNSTSGSNGGGGGGRGPGRPPTIDVSLNELFNEEDNLQKLNRIQRRGATLALIEITKYFDENLPEKLPKLWEMIIGKLIKLINPENFSIKNWLNKNNESEELVNLLQVLEITCKNLTKNLQTYLMENCLIRLSILLSHPYRAVRHLTSRCLSELSQIDSVIVMELIIDRILPKLNQIDNDIDRQGSIEVIACIIEKLQYNIIPYVVLLIVPLLGRMSDQNLYVRLMGTYCFATLIKLMPLDGYIPDTPKLKLSKLIITQRNKEREFLQQLLQPLTIKDYKLPIPITTELRSYQQAGINWLAFLNKYKLHGILCDDMGLGKTLQSICILASDHYYINNNNELIKLPSLVICPPTLTGHWVYEIEKFLSNKYLKPLQYNGTPIEREKLRTKFKKFNLIVASYDIVRKDILVFSNIKWNYIILDEGHVIKNGKTRTSIAIKNLISNHRLILSGTPIQNNVLELWSLFDFLMPGFLGTEKQFTAKYSKPILASRDPKSSNKEQEAGVLAMESLHRQVLPFLLRRVKEDVLDDLPPKITQDYYCELSKLQERLYDDFSKTQAHQTLQQTIINKSTNTTTTSSNSNSNNTHIFQALRYLQNVCNHPKLVLNSTHPQFNNIINELQSQNSKLDDINHSAKLPALKQLLQDCGIGVVNETQTTTPELIINQHRALIFCQLKSMLNIIENDLFKIHMPSVMYLRLDGSIPPSQRHSVVTRFNNDPSIDVLLLTTQVGGLGLNLTGADTVIFVEHDWNPMKDLQAMDRAHRIGQRKVVNVYRLITRGTLEEKIMGLQKFKVQTVNTIITGNNSKLETMGTDQLLDLFSHKPSDTNSSNSGSGSSSNNASVKTILETLPELWDQKQYDDEYDLTQFISKLN